MTRLRTASACERPDTRRNHLILQENRNPLQCGTGLLLLHCVRAPTAGSNPPLTAGPGLTCNRMRPLSTIPWAGLFLAPHSVVPPLRPVGAHMLCPLPVLYSRSASRAATRLAALLGRPSWSERAVIRSSSSITFAMFSGLGSADTIRSKFPA